MQSAIRLQCKSCGGNLTIDPQREVLICPFCGSEELITDSDAVAVEKIRQKTTSAYRNSKAGIVALVFAFICGGGCIGSFTSARNIYNVLYGTVLLIQTASFLLSFLERKEVIHLQKLLPFDGNKLPSLLMAVGFLLFIPALLLSTL